MTRCANRFSAGGHSANGHMALWATAPTGRGRCDPRCRRVRGIAAVSANEDEAGGADRAGERTGAGGTDGAGGSGDLVDPAEGVGAVAVLDADQLVLKSEADRPWLA